MNMNRLTCLGAAFILGIGLAKAEVRLPQILTDGMVVQRDRPLTLWGTASPGEVVTVKVVKGKKQTVTPNADGE